MFRCSTCHGHSPRCSPKGMRVRRPTRPRSAPRASPYRSGIVHRSGTRRGLSIGGRWRPRRTCGARTAPQCTTARRSTGPSGRRRARRTRRRTRARCSRCPSSPRGTRTCHWLSSHHGLNTGEASTVPGRRTAVWRMPGHPSLRRSGSGQRSRRRGLSSQMHRAAPAARTPDPCDLAGSGNGRRRTRRCQSRCLHSCCGTA